MTQKIFKPLLPPRQCKWLQSKKKTNTRQQKKIWNVFRKDGESRWVRRGNEPNAYRNYLSMPTENFWEKRKKLEKPNKTIKTFSDRFNKNIELWKHVRQKHNSTPFIQCRNDQCEHKVWYWGKRENHDKELKAAKNKMSTRKDCQISTGWQKENQPKGNWSYEKI